jgi:peptidyl-prolyl cis-trans isomerase C
MRINRPFLLTILVLTAALLAACGASETATSPADAATPGQDVPTIEPSPTTEPLAATVNGEAITMADYQASLTRYTAAQEELGTLLATEEAQNTVLEDLINRLLLAQAARQAGYTADETAVNERLAALVEQLGGQPALDEWLSANGYSLESFLQDLALEMEAAWMREQITAAVPETAEQVLARQVLFTDSYQAERYYLQLQSGTSFDTVVANADPQGLGYLDWFPRGYLLQPELEEAAFALQPGEYSAIIETELGYHILQVLDRDPERPLSPDARLTLQMQALNEWLAWQRAESQIEMLLP